MYWDHVVVHFLVYFFLISNNNNYYCFEVQKRSKCFRWGVVMVLAIKAKVIDVNKQFALIFRFALSDDEFSW